MSRVSRALCTSWRGALAVAGGACLSAALVFGVAAVQEPATNAPSPVPTVAAASPAAMPSSVPEAPVIATVAEPPDEAEGPGETPAPTHVLSDIREMDVPADGRISPPDLAHIYRVNGLPEGATWLAAHALSGGGEAPGNTFLTFAIGDRIEALGASWRVTERWTAGKGDANTQGPLTDPERYAGDLVLVTCLPRDGGSALSNTWLVAEPLQP